MSVIFRPHPVRGEVHIQRNANREVATLILRFETGMGNLFAITDCINSGLSWVCWRAANTI